MKIFIAEEIPSLNKGEAAILYGMIESFRVLQPAEVSLLSFSAETDKKAYKNLKIIDASDNLNLSNDFQKNKKSKLFQSFLVFIRYLYAILLYKLKFSFKSEGSIWKEYFETDIIIIGHDGTFSGFFGSIPFLHVYNLLIAKSFKKHIVIYGGSIELQNKFQNIIARYILKRVDLITLRDENSFQHYNDLNVNNNNVFLTADLAFLLNPIPLSDAKELLINEGISFKKPLIGMTVTKEIFNSCFPEIKNIDIKYEKSISLFSELIDYMVESFDVSIIFLPHCIGPGKDLDDRIVSKDVYDMVKNKDKVYLIENEYSPDQLKGMMGHMELFIGQRLHSVIGSLSMKIPSIAILHAFNRNKILSDVLDEKWVIKTYNLEFEMIKNSIDDLWANRMEVKKVLESNIPKVINRSKQNSTLIKKIYEGS